MLEVMKCRNCNKELTTDMELEYSMELTSYFCKADCALDYYFDYMRSGTFITKDKTDEELVERGIEIRGGKLYQL